MTAPIAELGGDPYRLAELCVGLERVRVESAAYWDTFSDDDFFREMGMHWSAADHVRHLTRSMRPVTSALRLPRWALRLAFGRPPADRRDYPSLRAEYRAALAAGGEAGRYAPDPLPPEGRTPAERRRIVGYHAAAVEGLVHTVMRWRDADLDRAALPHPLLGRLTVREMVIFTLYHNVHHVQVAARRRDEAGW